MILYALFRVFEFLLRLLPYALRKKVFIFLGTVAYYLDRQHRAVIARNLDLAFGETLSDAQRHAITRYCYRNLMLNFFQVVENRHLSPQEQGRYVRFENTETFQQLRDEGKAVILVSGHFGNWELGATAFAFRVAPTVSIHKPLNNLYFNRYLLESRSRFHMQMIEKRGALRHLTRALKNKETISLLIDQNLGRKESEIVDFFGHPVTQTSAPAYLARKFDAVLIPVFIHSDDERHYTVRFELPIEVAHTDDAEADVKIATQQQAEALERVVRAEPKHWFWCHRRWKAGMPGVYRDL